MKYQWILFDLDNTLTDFDVASHAAFEKLCEELLKVDYTPELYASYKVHNGSMWQAFERNEIDTKYLRWKRFDLFFKANDIEFDSHEANKFYLFEMTKAATLKVGSLDLLKKLHGDFKLAIITNGLQENQRTILDNLDLTKYFEAIIVSDEIGASKPSKEFFDITFDTIGQEAIKSSLVVGDNIGSDIEGAIGYGLDSCWFNEHGKVNNTDLKPTFTISRIEELLDCIYTN